MSLHIDLYEIFVCVKQVLSLNKTNWVLKKDKFNRKEGFALGIEVKILFALFLSKKIVTESPPERPRKYDYLIFI